MCDRVTGLCLQFAFNDACIFVQNTLIGLLQQTITRYKIRHTEGQAHYYFRTGTLKQRDLNLSSLTCLCFNVSVRDLE